MGRSADGRHRSQEPAPAQVRAGGGQSRSAADRHPRCQFGAPFVGSVEAHRLLPDTMILAYAGTSGDTGQFNVVRHALRWIHAAPRASGGWFTSSTPSRPSAPPKSPSALS